MKWEEVRTMIYDLEISEINDTRTINDIGAILNEMAKRIEKIAAEACINLDNEVDIQNIRKLDEFVPMDIGDE